MNSLDLLNAFFPFVGCFFVILNIKKLYQDKEVKGIQWYSPLFFYTGQLVNVYFMFYLNQWASFIGGLLLYIICMVWFCMMIYYNFWRRK